MEPLKTAVIIEPTNNVLYRYPLFDELGQTFARVGYDKYIALSELKHVLRVERLVPRKSDDEPAVVRE